MAYDGNLEIDEVEVICIGTLSVRDGVAPGDVIDAIVGHWAKTGTFIK